MFGYARVSTQLQAQFGSSIDTQIQLLVDECQRHQYDDSQIMRYDEMNQRVRYNLIRIYVDNGISAKNITDRHALVELKRHVSSLVNGRSHQKLGIIVSDLSRLTRSSEDLELLLKWINNDSIKLKFIDNSIDPTTNSGKLMLSMMASFYEFERKNSSFKTKLTLRSMSESGTLTGHCSYGWTSGVDDSGRKNNIPVPEEQEGLNEVLRISRENPELTASQIKNIMNESGILCLRGPGKNFRGNKITEKNIERNRTQWTGKWTTPIIEKILEHDRFNERQSKVKVNSNIIKKDEIVISEIKKYLNETNGYENDTFNFSEIARFINNKYIFHKEIHGDYIKEMMLIARIIRDEKVNNVVNNDEETLNIIRNLITEFRIIGYTQLTELLKEHSVPLIGKRKSWTVNNVRDLCIKNNIDVFN